MQDRDGTAGSYATKAEVAALEEYMDKLHQSTLTEQKAIRGHLDRLISVTDGLVRLVEPLVIAAGGIIPPNAN